MAIRIDVKGSYTEATHTAYGDVTGAEPMSAGGRMFTPEQISVRYSWRTQLGDTGWTIGNIHISGRWCDHELGAGSGSIIVGEYNGPEWALQFAKGNMPTSLLTERRRVDHWISGQSKQQGGQQ